LRRGEEGEKKKEEEKREIGKKGASAVPLFLNAEQVTGKGGEQTLFPLQKGGGNFYRPVAPQGGKKEKTPSY